VSDSSSGIGTYPCEPGTRPDESARSLRRYLTLYRLAFGFPIIEVKEDPGITADLMSTMYSYHEGVEKYGDWSKA
jgi:hypothetical protein